MTIDTYSLKFTMTRFYNMVFLQMVDSQGNWKETAKINIHLGWIISVEIVIAPEGGNPLQKENTDDCDYSLICTDALLRQNLT